jgi:tripartite-type tricarboxylate transporter receptor subunit TctC
MKKREVIKRLGAAAGLSVLGTRSFATDVSGYPSRHIRVIAGFPPGAMLDPLLRVLAEDARTVLKQPILIEAKPGAGGVLPAVQLNQSAPDGYTVAVLTSGLFRSPYVEQFNGDPTVDLTYVIGLSGWVFGLVVPASSPIRNMADYVAYAKANPGALNYTSAGMGTIPHMVMEEIQRSAGITLNHVPYKGTTEALTALVAGHVQSSADASGWVPYVDSGQLRLLSVWGDRRLARYPNVPTLRESGFDISDTSPWGLVAPKGTNPQVVKALHDAFKQAMDGEPFKKLLAQMVMEPAYMSPQQYQEWAVARRHLERERASRSPVAKS